MLFLRRPADKQVHALLTERESMTFSYSAVGATRSAVPPGYGINHMRAFLGEGDAVRVRAIKAVLVEVAGSRRTRALPEESAHKTTYQYRLTLATFRSLVARFLSRDRCI